MLSSKAWAVASRVGRWYWKYLRSRRALADHISFEEACWSGKLMLVDELQEHVDMWKGRVRY